MLINSKQRENKKITATCTNCPLLNYLILTAKLYLWGCRKNQTLPSITAFSSKVEIKNETEKSICVKQIKWTNLIRSGLCLWTLYPSNVCTPNVILSLLYSYFSVKVYSVM